MVKETKLINFIRLALFSCCCCDSLKYFSTVPHQKHAKVCPLTIGYIEELLKKIKTPNKFKIEVKDTSDPWYGDYSHWNYEAAKTATKQVIVHYHEKEFKSFPK